MSHFKVALCGKTRFSKDFGFSSFPLWQKKVMTTTTINTHQVNFKISLFDLSGEDIFSNQPYSNINL